MNIDQWMTRLRGDDVNSILAHGSFVIFMIRVISAFLAFVLQLVLARLLGVAEYGMFVYALSWLMVLGMVSRFGMENGLTRLVAQYQAQQSWALLAGVLQWSFRNTLLMSLAVALIAIVATALPSTDMESTQRTALLLALLVLPFMSLSVLRQGALRGLRHVGQADFPESILRPVFMLVVLAVMGYYQWTITAPVAMAITGTAYLLAFALGSWWLWQALPGKLRAVEPERQSSAWWKISIPLMFVQGMQVLLSRVDVLMLGSMTDAETTGIYGAVIRIADLVVLGLMVVNPIAAPLISELFHSGKKIELQRMVTFAARITTAVTVVVAIFLALFGQWVLDLFGQEFSAGYMALMIVLAGQIVNALSGSVGYIMSMTGHQVASAVILAVTAFMNIVLNYLLIPRFGIEGAAIATAVSIAGWNIAMVVYARVKIGVRSTII